MPDAHASRFTPQNKTTHERLTTTTVGLVALSDFRKRRAEVLEQQEREAREAALSATNTQPPDRSLASTPATTAEVPHTRRPAKKRKKRTRALVSFGDDDDEERNDSDDVDVGVENDCQGRDARDARDACDADDTPIGSRGGLDDSGAPASSHTNNPPATDPPPPQQDSDTSAALPLPKPAAKLAANALVSVVPRAVTKAALRREAAEREALRKEFLALQAAVKATEVAIPFVFYDGTNISGGTVRLKKGDLVWLFLDKARKVGAHLGVGGSRTNKALRAWARVSVGDLMLVRGTIIIPHHYEFYFFIMNKSIGPGNQPLFDWSAEASLPNDPATPVDPLSKPDSEGAKDSTKEGVKDGTKAGTKAGTRDGGRNRTRLDQLEGFGDDPTFTKVVDRRWYERNKHIYPASTWQEFDPEKDYQNEIRRDLGGNAFFFAK